MVLANFRRCTVDHVAPRGMHLEREQAPSALELLSAAASVPAPVSTGPSPMGLGAQPPIVTNAAATAASVIERSR